MKFKRLEAARGLAAVYVLLHHAVPRGTMLLGLPVSQLFRFGQEAVILFFLLSGFVIAYSVSVREQTTGHYFKARFVRIFTPLIPVFALSYGVQCLLAGRLIGPDLPGLAGNLFMLQDLQSLPGTITPPYMNDNPLWSLSYEWWFYMAFIPLMKLRRPSIVVFGAAALAAAAYPWFPHWTLRVVFHMAIWWTGYLAAKGWLAGKLSPTIVLPLTGVTAVLAASVIISRAGYHGLGVFPVLEVRHLATGAAFMAGAFAWRALKWIGFNQTVGLFAVIAPVSYGLYIVHHPLLQLAALWGQTIGLLPATVLAIAIAFALAWLLEVKLYRWVKKGLAA